MNPKDKLTGKKILITRDIDVFTDDDEIICLHKGYQGTIVGEKNELNTVPIAFNNLFSIQLIYPSDFYVEVKK